MTGPAVKINVFYFFSSWMVVLKKENPKRINWLECTLEDKIPEYKEWITARRLEEAEGLEQERKIA